MGAVLVEWHERWRTDPRCFTVEACHEAFQARYAVPGSFRSAAGSWHQQNPDCSIVGT